jgi:7-keto-8-aminopelargonate synthetase-like enzyme
LAKPHAPSIVCGKELRTSSKRRIKTDRNGFKKKLSFSSDILISTGNSFEFFITNNYLGLSSHPEVIQATKDAMDTHGFGMSSVRFICGT